MIDDILIVNIQDTIQDTFENIQGFSPYIKQLYQVFTIHCQKMLKN